MEKDQTSRFIEAADREYARIMEESEREYARIMVESEMARESFNIVPIGEALEKSGLHESEEMIEEWNSQQWMRDIVGIDESEEAEIEWLAQQNIEDL